MKIQRHNMGVEGEKRMNIPFKVISECPRCNKEVTNDYTKDSYVSYPEFGRFTELYFYHECGDGGYWEWQSTVILDVTLKQA